MSAQTSAAPAAPAAPAPVRGPRRQVSPGVVLGVILIAQLMVVLDATIVNVALPKIQTALDFTPTGLSWVLSAYTLAFGGLLLFGARAGDLFGRRRVFVTGMALFAASSFVGGFATTVDLADRLPRRPGSRRRARGARRARPADVHLHRPAASAPAPSACSPASPSAGRPSASSPADCSPSGSRGAG